MTDSYALMSKLRDFLDSTLPLTDESLTAIARDERIDLSKILHWRDKSKTGGPDQLLRLFCSLRRRTGESWDKFGSRADGIFLSGVEDGNEKRKDTKRTGRS